MSKKKKKRTSALDAHVTASNWTILERTNENICKSLGVPKKYLQAQPSPYIEWRCGSAENDTAQDGYFIKIIYALIEYVVEKAPQANTRVARYEKVLLIITIEDIPMPFWKNVVAPGIGHILSDWGQVGSYRIENKDENCPTFTLRVGEIR